MTLHLLSISLGVFIVIVGAAILYAVARHYRRSMGLQAQERETNQETGFIINAFHEVTKQLKEKERELERLRSLAEQRADNVESYNENILQCVTSGVMTFDRDCMLTTMNRAAGEMLGITHEAKTGKSCRDLFGEGEITRAVHETIEKKKASARMEAMLERSSGKIWLGYNTAILTDRQGEALGVILSFSDLTEVKLLQEQMELRQRLTALGEMSAGIAHELRNPMAVIAGYLNLLSKKTGPESQSIIRDITSEINGMNRIIGDLLTFARPASLNRIRLNLRELIEGCIASTLQATGADGRITTAVRIGKIEISLDEVLMRQAFTNLFQNAIEAMPDGGTLSVEARDGKNIALSVADTGTGIPKDALSKLFLPFFTTKDKGVGLGLALVHKIILSHGGTIEVKSKEGAGTTFTVMLPKG
jgi:two-component system, NtrC family, sensor histidine kinase AtoS